MTRVGASWAARTHLSASFIRRPARTLPVRAALLAVGLAFACQGAPAKAQTNGGAVGLPEVPTTRILAMGHLTAKASPAQMRGVMPSEVSETVKLYLSGRIADWYVRKDMPGVVFILDVRDVAEARSLLAGLPLGRAGLMDFDFVPLGPLAPLNLLAPKP